MLNHAIQWIHRQHLDGQAMPVTDKNRKPYPEVTGYYIPTLLAIGEVAMAERFARWLVSIQNADGSFSLEKGSGAFVFDTGQVIRGWVAIIDRLPELAQPLRRACDWIVNGADPATGRLLAPKPRGAWSLGARGEVSEGIHLYVLQPLRDAARVLGAPHIAAAADKALAHYLATVPATDFTGRNMLSHFYGYIQEAFVELGLPDLARQGMASAARFQAPNGSVPGYSDVGWVCSTGLAQLAKVWYQLGDLERADRAMAFLAQLRNSSGAFYGSYGIDASYFPGEEISWAVKYWIEAEQLRIARHFDTTAVQYAPTIAAHDERAQVVLAELAQLPQARRVLDAGCGKGRYAALVQQQQRPGLAVHAVDVSGEMLRHVPAGIQTRQSSIQALPYPDGHFDLVYCIEALEHVPNPPAALAEMQRVLAPGGRMVVIDKNLARLGSLKIESWERWFGVEELAHSMTQLGLAASARYIGYDGRPADGLFVAWTGVKPLVARPSVNFYRSTFYDDTNRQLVAACLRQDKAWIAAHLAAQDAAHPEMYSDELFDNRVGMQLIAQILGKAGSLFDVVDVGCGHAQMLRRLKAAGHRVTGVDASALRVVDGADVPVLQGFSEALPIDHEAADVVISQEAMEHVMDLDAALRECGRILRPGGVFLCKVPLGTFADGVNHVRLFNPASLRAAVVGVGFEVLNLWRVAYLNGQEPNNLFIAAAKPGQLPATAVLRRMLQSLSPA